VDETVSVMFMFVPLRLMVHSKLFHQAALVFWWPVAISAGGYHEAGLKTNGTVEVWGDGSYGQTLVPGTLSTE